MNKLRHWASVAGSVGIGIGLMVSVPAFAATAQSSQGQTMTMEATAYGPSAQDNYPYGATDYFGQPLTAGDIAVDPSVIPLHTCLYVTGYQSPSLPSGGYIGEADDEGGAIKGMHVDLYMNEPENLVNNFGIQTVKVTVLGPANNTSLSGTAACAQYATDIPGSGNTSPNGNAVSGSTSPAASAGSSSSAPSASSATGSRITTHGGSSNARKTTEDAAYHHFWGWRQWHRRWDWR